MKIASSAGSSTVSLPPSRFIRLAGRGDPYIGPQLAKFPDGPDGGDRTIKNACYHDESLNKKPVRLGAIGVVVQW